ncbi:MAG: hypothetical protein SF123_03260 [Chloroflexota bacterium]|nr:hypothetical protein [Chloroflexota bacterium]
MPSHNVLRNLLAVFGLVAIFAVVGVVFGQDNDGNDAANTGTPGLTDALDNLNLPAVPPPPLTNDEETDGTPSTTLTPPTVPPNAVCPCTPAAPITRLGSGATAAVPSELNRQMAASVPRLARFGRSGINLKQNNIEAAILMEQTPRIGIRFGNSVSARPAMVAFGTSGPELFFQSRETFQHDGYTIIVTEDYLIEVVADNGTVWFSGQAGVVGNDRIIIQGSDDLGHQYAIADGYLMANTPDGDILIDNGTTTYIYDFDEMGALVGLTDSDDNPYTVEFDPSGTISIADVDGVTSTFAEDGSFVMVDADGTVLEQSSLYGDEDDERTVRDETDDEDADDNGEANNSDSGSGETDPPDDGGSAGDGE